MSEWNNDNGIIEIATLWNNLVMIRQELLDNNSERQWFQMSMCGL